MLIYKKGDLLQAIEDIICHQVNEMGVMGGGLAKQIADTYPEVEEEYMNYSQGRSPSELLGLSLICDTHSNNQQLIANCYTQDDMNTRLDLIEKVFDQLLRYCKEGSFTIAIPYGYGCGIANGDWSEVSALFYELSQKHQVDIAVYNRER